MEIVLHERAAAFAALARPLYERDPDRHTVALTALEGMVKLDEPADALLTVAEQGAATGALLCTVGRAALVSGVAPDQAAAVVGALAEAGVRLPGVVGPVAEAEVFAAAFVARHGGEVVRGMASRLFALGELTPPSGVPGAARLARDDDVELLARWRDAFAVEAVHGNADPRSPREIAARSLALGNGELFWEAGAGPVAQANANRPVAGMSRIGPVYTPPEQRGHGYAAAVTAAAAQWALDAGATRVVLFTDLANPTTNRLYPRIGFRPVHDAVELEFRA